MKTSKFLLAIISLMISGCFSVSAETVSQKQASAIARTFFNAAYQEVVSPPKMVWNGKNLTTDRLFSPFYVYNHPKGGFVIISAENKAFPILAYSKSAVFNKDRLSEEEKDLFTQYAREIEIIRYDSRTPQRAIEAWQNLPVYINDVLTAPYSTPEYETLSADSQEIIEQIDRRNGWIVMPSAVEFNIYNPERYRNYNLEDVLGEEEYIPFSFYEQFINDIAEEDRARQAMLDEIIMPSKPVVSILGGAHYSIQFPGEIKLVRLYSLDGLNKLEKYFNSQNHINLDLSALPQGYYVMMALSDKGEVYGLKLSR